MKTIYDVAIVGAGPGGTTTAAYLAQAGLRVLLLDKANFPRDKTCGDALSPNALHVLNDLGLSDALDEISFRLNGVRLVAPNGNEMAAPIPQKPGRVSYLRIGPRFQLDNLLLQHAVSKGAEFFPGVRVTNIRIDDDRVDIVGMKKNDQVRYAARVGVVAVGANISLLQRSGLIARHPQFSLAARAYFENIADLDDKMEIRFDGVPLPGYGWIFPTSESSANIGAGIIGRSSKMPYTARTVFDQFLQHTPVRERLADSQLIGPVKSFPLRMDFATAQTCSNRVLLVGEAIGLVNPFTGEGIDYAMESGQIAAQVLIQQLQRGDVSLKALHEYDRRLRERFQKLFVWTKRMQRIYMNEWLLNPLVRAGACERYVEKIILEVLLNYRNPVQALSPRTILHVLKHWG